MNLTRGLLGKMISCYNNHTHMWDAPGSYCWRSSSLYRRRLFLFWDMDSISVYPWTGNAVSNWSSWGSGNSVGSKKDILTTKLEKSPSTYFNDETEDWTKNKFVPLLLRWFFGYPTKFFLSYTSTLRRDVVRNEFLLSLTSTMKWMSYKKIFIAFHDKS